jgi:hypothetical protein
MSDREQTEPIRDEDPAADDHGGAELPGESDAPASNQRLRAILAGLVTVAVLAVLAIAVFSEDDDGGDSQNPPATVAASDGTGGEEGNTESAEEPGGEELGSLALSAYLCPEADSDESECLDGGPVPIMNAVVKLEDGRTFSLEGTSQGEDGMYAWLNIPIGQYVLLAEGLTGPDGATARAVIGSNGQTAEGWLIANLDPNQPAEVRIIFTSAAGEGTAVG